jgi:tetratricopeptide (TPR) repeat protein
MYLRISIKIIVFLLLLARAAGALAAPSDDFDAGVRYFKNNNFPLALEYLGRAEATGMQSAQLDYNLGSVYYKLEQYEFSKRYFEKLVTDKNLGALAYYNLGLIAHKSGQDNKAIKLFEKSITSTQDTALVSLAKKQINTLKSLRPKPWFAFVSASYGYDSNITLLPSSSASDESGSFLQTLALADWKVSGNTSNGLHTSVFFLSTDYQDSNDFDDDSFMLGVEYRERIDDWKFAYGLEWEQSTSGGEDYLTSTGLVLKAQTSLADNRVIRLRLLYEDISNRSTQFGFLDGSRMQFRAAYRYKTKAREYRFEYEQEFNDRANTATESFSPTRHKLGFRYFNDLSAKTRIGMGLEFRDSDYQSVPSQNRNDERTRVRFESRHKIDPNWSIDADIIFTDNYSSVEESEYDKYRVNISLNALF